MTALAQFEKAWFVIMPFNKKKVGQSSFCIWGFIG